MHVCQKETKSEWPGPYGAHRLTTASPCSLQSWDKTQSIDALPIKKPRDCRRACIYSHDCKQRTTIKEQPPLSVRFSTAWFSVATRNQDLLYNKQHWATLLVIKLVSLYFPADTWPLEWLSWCLTTDYLAAICHSMLLPRLLSGSLTR